MFTVACRLAVGLWPVLRLDFASGWLVS